MRLGEEAVFQLSEADARFGVVRMQARGGTALHEGMECDEVLLGGAKCILEGKKGHAVAFAIHLLFEGNAIAAGFSGGDAAVIAAESFSAAGNAAAGFAGWVDVGAGRDHGGVLSGVLSRSKGKGPPEGRSFLFFTL